jgi:GNAT superfamily N-acetyltransferase
MITVREVSDPTDPAIPEFGRLQRSVYYAPETLIPAQYIPNMLGAPSGPRLNVLLLAEDDAGRVVGGALFHAFRVPLTGFSSFLGVSRDHRGQGVARMLHTARFAALDRVLGTETRGVFIDVVSPARLPADELEREQAIGSNPCDRRRAFQALGFRQVGVRYEQPVGGPNGGPVTILDLLYCPRQAASSVAIDVVTETMRAYWSPWLGEARAARHADELRARAGNKPNLALLPADQDCV